MFEEFVLLNYSTEESREYAKNCFKWFEKFLKEKGKNEFEIGKKEIIEFRRWLEERRSRNGKKLNPKTIRNILDVVKSYYEFLEGLGYRNPFREISPKVLKSIFPKTKKSKVPREFNDEELEKIYNELKKRDKEVFVACLIALLSGARLREVLNLRKEDFFERDGNLFIVIRYGKGMKERISILGIPNRDFINKEKKSKIVEKINEEGLKIIKDFIKDKEGYVFGDEDNRRRLRWRIQQTIYRISKKLNIKFRFHDFRSNWGCKALNCRIPLEYIRMQLGHSLTATTERYYARIKEEIVLKDLISSI